VANNGGEKDRPEDGLPTELLEKYFKFFKHLTTLNVATAIVVLAISQARPAGLALVLVPLLVFGVSLLISLGGMEVVLACLSKQDGSEITVTLLGAGPLRLGSTCASRSIFPSSPMWSRW
jgi:hypothetical protein